MQQQLRMCLAELFGTFLLVLIAAGTICASFLPVDTRSGAAVTWLGGPSLAAALAEGCVLAVALTATFHLSPGCLNPAVTLALWVLKRIEGVQAALLIAVQMVGALLAGLALRGLFQENVLAQARMGTPHLTRALVPGDGGVSLGSLLTGSLLEAAFAALLMVAVFASLFDRRAPKLGGALVGMAQVAIVLAGYHLTGGCANPARWFGSAIWQLTLAAGPATVRPLADHLVYWVGPIVGALAGGIFYSAVILPDEKK
jgi:glycerol uptake facilitator-like aquaporin